MLWQCETIAFTTLFDSFQEANHIPLKIKTLIFNILQNSLFSAVRKQMEKIFKYRKEMRVAKIKV